MVLLVSRLSCTFWAALRCRKRESGEEKADTTTPVEESNDNKHTTAVVRVIIFWCMLLARLEIMGKKLFSELMGYIYNSRLVSYLGLDTAVAVLLLFVVKNVDIHVVVRPSVRPSP